MLEIPGEGRDLLFTLTVDLVTGVCEQVSFPSVKDQVADPPGVQQFRSGEYTRIFFPPSKQLPNDRTFVLNVQPVVDQSFQKKFSNFKEAVDLILAMANLFFKHSQAFKIELKWLPAVAIENRLPANYANLE